MNFYISTAHLAMTFSNCSKGKYNYVILVNWTSELYPKSFQQPFQLWFHTKIGILFAWNGSTQQMNLIDNHLNSPSNFELYLKGALFLQKANSASQNQLTDPNELNQ